MSFHYIKAHFFLTLNNITLYGSTRFICSPTEGHLVHFQVLAIIDKAAINICIQVLCGHKFSTHLGKYLGVQLLDCMVRLCLAL